MKPRGVSVTLTNCDAGSAIAMLDAAAIAAEHGTLVTATDEELAAAAALLERFRVELTAERRLRDEAGA